MFFFSNHDQVNCVETENKVIPPHPHAGQSLNTPNSYLSSEEIIRNNYVQKKENMQSPSTEQRCL